MKDKTIECIQCGDAFVFTVSEQKRFLSHGFNIPKRCTECRKKKTKDMETGNGWRSPDKKRRRHRKEDHEFFEL
jgi:hypothetical protein